jgi:uncharacterized membrane protein
LNWLTPGVVLGVGFGGFLDGIVLHQIVQWHNMGSAVVRPHTMEAMSRNMVWDGQFHLVVWVITLVGVFMLRSEARTRSGHPPVIAFAGQLILGWGMFNIVEGVLDHHVLGLHHVRDLPVHVPAYDWVFLAVGGVGCIALGAVLILTTRDRVVSQKSASA